MTKSNRSAWTGLALAGFVALGCAEDPEADYREATRTVGEAQEAVEEAEAAVAARRAELEGAQQELAEAREDLSAARAGLRDAESRVDVEITDAHLFRAVQRRLLEDRALGEVGISAEVDRAVVTLSGRVEKPAQRDRAVEVAEEVPGVVEVVSRIQVVAPKSKPK